MSKYIDADKLRYTKIIGCYSSEKMAVLEEDIENAPAADVKHVRHGHWILEPKHWFNDYGECIVYVVASCSECKKVWHNDRTVFDSDRTVFDRVLYDYNNDDTPNPITDERIQRCKEHCLQEAEKYLLTESPFCEKCGAKMDRKETEE